MKVWAISDTHLCTTDPTKKMDRFGEIWIDHPTKIRNNWLSVVEDQDIILIPGDICWANLLGDGIKELEFFVSLPGEKVFVKGNHDFWWDSISKIRKLSPPRLHFIQNDAVCFRKFGIGGTRLWAYDFVKWPCVVRNLEIDEKTKDQPEPDQNWLNKVRKREINRLHNSLGKIPDDTFKIAMVHFPPIDEEGNENELSDIMTQHKVQICIFGHLHGIVGNPIGSDIIIGGTRYILVSSDFLEFKPKLIGEG